MSKGMEIRAQIDTETVKGLLIINGGGAVALLALLPTVVGKPEFESMLRWVLAALFVFQIGLLSAVIHNRFRRECSLAYEEAQRSSPFGFPERKLFIWKVKEPNVCIRSIIFMWASLAMFMLASVLVLVGGVSILGSKSESAKQQPIEVHVSPVIQLISPPTNTESGSRLPGDAPKAATESSAISDAKDNLESKKSTLPPNNSLQARRP